MIKVNGNVLQTIPSAEGFDPNELQKRIFEVMKTSDAVYEYDNEKVLITELRLRNSIVNASRDLEASRFSFRVFRKSKANPDYWIRTPEGGFQLKSDLLPSDGIADIYRNSHLYGTECSTAMIIVLYKALLDVMPKENYNRMYSNIYLMNWNHLDRDLAIISYPSSKDELPGDGRYFINPDVDPLTPELQGENVYYLGNGRYYGHGMGIADAQTIIRNLNNARKENATRSAYLLDSVKRQSYSYLSRFM